MAYLKGRPADRSSLGARFCHKFYCNLGRLISPWRILVESPKLFNDCPSSYAVSVRDIVHCVVLDMVLDALKNQRARAHF